MDTTSSLCNDILAYLTTNPSSFSLSSLNTQTATSGSLFSFSPTTDHCADFTSEAYQNLWAPKQNWVSKAAAQDGCSEDSLLNLSDPESHCRYKTELCRPFEESGFCRYGNRCQFAHGKQELRTVDRHPKYKTQLCKTFHTTGLCRYGKRCHFIHNEEEGGQIHQLIPRQQQQQRPVSGLRKLTGRQNMESAEGQQQLQAYSILPTSVSSSTSRYAEELSPVSGMSLPSSTASSPSPSLASFNDDIFSSSAASEISQIQSLRKAPTSPYSPVFRSTDLFAHPSILLPATDSASVQPKGITSRDDDSSHKDVIDLVLRHLTKTQLELFVEYLCQKEKRNAFN